MRRIIPLELWKGLKFHHTNKWYMYKPVSIIKNEILKILRDFKIQTKYLIPARRPDLVRIKRECHLMYFCSSKRPHSEIERKLKVQWIPWPYLRTENVVEHEDDDDNQRSWSSYNRLLTSWKVYWVKWMNLQSVLLRCGPRPYK